MRAASALLAVAAAAAVLAAASARADIYGYIDGGGTAHFATEKLDERYRLFVRGDRPFDSSLLRSPAPAAQAEAPFSSYLLDHPNLKKYEPLLRQAAEEFALDPALLKAVMAAESGFDPLAVSPKGAVGLMQVLPATAERYGLQADKRRTVAQKLTDPKTNIRLAARYLRDLSRLFPFRPDLVIASYNAGEKAVQKYDNRIPPYPETQNYVRLVSQFYRLYKPSSGGTAASGASDAGAGRIHMTIPGRRNLPHSTIEYISNRND